MDTQDESMRDLLTIYLKGMCMGAADTVPGISGGTVALIVGIYDRLIDALAAIDPRVVANVIAIHDPVRRERLRDDLIAMDVQFLLALGAGMVTAVLVVSRFVSVALDDYRTFIYAFFFGLIVASAVVLYRQVRLDTVGRVLAAVAGFAIAYVVVGITSGGAQSNLLGVFVAGAIAVSAMILPGVSGAVFLLILGQYDFMVDALTRTVDGIAGVFQGGSVADLVEPGTVVVTFVVGAGIGLLTTARIVGWAFDRYRMATLAFLVSLMVGSLRLPVSVMLDVPEWTTYDAALVVFAAVAGAVAVIALDRYTGSLEYVAD